MKYLVDYAFSFLHMPYRWGGYNPIEGYDCSGFVQEILASVGIDPPGDQTAQALYNLLEKTSSPNKWGVGSLAFFGASVTKITHVAFCIDQYRMIEAGGGGSTTLTTADAIKQNAFVRIRPISNRKDLVAMIRPNYSKIGLI